MLYATPGPGRYRYHHRGLQALRPLLSQALAETFSAFQGSKGEPGKGELVDYNGSINEALQVSGLYSGGWGSAGSAVPLPMPFPVKLPDKEYPLAFY